MTDAPTIFWMLYLILGPLAWMGMLTVFLMGRRRMLRLRDEPVTVLSDPPHVTILVPGKDEADQIEQGIRSILGQDYPNFRVIAINDRSTDQTGAILDRLAAEYPQKLSVMHIAPGSLPEGWLGKCNALHLAAARAEGEWLFFVDSDVTLQADALSRAMGLSVPRRYDALSILTRLVCQSFWERLLLPLAGGAWAVMNAASLTNVDSVKRIAVANGQFFLIRRSAYEAVGGHGAVRAEITEDVALMRLLKRNGCRTRFMLGAHLASTRMHSSLKQIVHGWGRILSGSTLRRPGRLVGAILFLILCGFSVYPALAWGVIAAVRYADPKWLVAAATHLGLITMYLAIIYRSSGNPMRNAWLFPLGGTLLLWIFAFALRICQTGRLTWRETNFQIPVQTRG